MQFTPMAIADVLLLEPQVHGDARGFFMETWRESEFLAQVPGVRFVQDNHSGSTGGTLRGLHYQVTRPQGKLVRVVRGAVFDVAVDLRRRSKNFGRWVACELSAENRRQMWVPPGFAHGFLALGEYAELVYKCTDYYDAEDERTLLWEDDRVGIDWPLSEVGELILSDKDRAGTPFEHVETYP